MASLRMFWLLILAPSFLLNNLFSEAKHDKNLPSAVVVGTVYCDTCFQQDFSTNNHIISGATVGVKCRENGANPDFYKEVKTNEHGVFKVHLPIAVSKHVKRIQGCSVKLISSNEPFCAVASSATSSALHLKSRKQGTHIFSAGFFTFKPLKQPELCNQKPSENYGSRKDFFPHLPENPTMPNLPPISLLPPLPPLPTLPTLPSLPPLFGRQPSLPVQPLPNVPTLPTLQQQPAIPGQPQGEELAKARVQPAFFFPPIFPSPPPAVGGLPLPPNPLQPPPLLPPVPGLTPPTPPAFPLPPIPTVPGLTPPSPPPPAFPQFPFPPIPGFPGIPPPSHTKEGSP